MKEPILIHQNIKDNLKIEGEFDYLVKLDIGLAEGGDFALFIEFLDLTLDDVKSIKQLSSSQRRLSLKSDFIEKEKFNITHVVVTKFTISGDLDIKWECLSDDPSLYADF